MKLLRHAAIPLVDTYIETRYIRIAGGFAELKGHQVDVVMALVSGMDQLRAGLPKASWPDLSGQTPGLSGRTTPPLCANTCIQYMTCFLFRIQILMQ